MHNNLEPIWDAVDREQYAQALTLIQKSQRRQPSNSNLQNLQAFCLAKENRIPECLDVCERIRKRNTGSYATYQTVHDVLKDCRDAKACAYLVNTMEMGYKEVKSEAMGRLWFMDSVQVSAFMSQRKAAVELQKGFLSRDYFFFMVMSNFTIWLHSKDEKERVLLSMIILRFMTKAAENLDGDASNPGASIKTTEELLMYIGILLKFGRIKEALDVLNGHHGQKHAGSQELRAIKLDVLKMQEAGKSELSTFCRDSIEHGLDDWTFFKSYIETSAEGASDFLKNWAAKHPTRNALLATVFEASKAQSSAVLEEPSIAYIRQFPAKHATYEDLAPYVISLDVAAYASFLRQISSLQLGLSETDQVIFDTNCTKFENLRLFKAGSDKQQLNNFVMECLRKQFDSVKVETDLYETDNQFGDDLLLMACHAILKLNGDYARQLVVILLEYGLSRSKHNFQIKNLLLMTLRELGAWSYASEVYQSLQIKQTQKDTLSFMLYEHATYEYASTAHITGLRTSQTIYAANRQETPEMLCKAYEHGSYSRVEEFLDFQCRLEHSIWWKQSTASIMKLQILLDKFDWSVPIRMDFSHDLYDNKSRNVMMNIFTSPVHMAQKKSRIAEEADTIRLKGTIVCLQVVQAIIRNDVSFITLPTCSATSTSSEAVADVVYRFTLYLFSLSPASKTLPDHASSFSMLPTSPIAELEDTLHDLQVHIDSGTTGKHTLHRIGTLVDCLKTYSLVSRQVHVRNHATWRNAREGLAASMSTLLTGTRALIASYVKTTAVPVPYSDILAAQPGIDELIGAVGGDGNLSALGEAAALRVLQRVRTSQCESLTCLLSVLRSITL